MENPDDRPDLPYVVGLNLKLHRHIPPPPFGHPYPNPGHYIPRFERCSELERQLTFCLSTPPLEGSRVTQAALSVEITRQIAVGKDRGPQVVAVSNRLVAKIYDPLYYLWDDGYEHPFDVVWEADRHYTREAAAYEKLDKDFGGKTIPKYHGSWTFDIATETPSGLRTRSVRLILLEHLEGTTLFDIKSSQLTEELRSDILAAAMEAETDIIYHGGVSHGDFELRNIFACSPSKSETEMLRIVLLDFNRSIIPSLTKRPPRDYKFPNLPFSPIERFWGSSNKFCPNWIESKDHWRIWLFKRWYGSSRYMPVTATDLRLSEEDFAALVESAKLAERKVRDVNFCSSFNRPSALDSSTTSGTP